MIVLPQDWEDKNVNTSLLDGQDGEKSGNETTSHHHTPFLYLEGGEGGRDRGEKEGWFREQDKAEWVWDRPEMDVTPPPPTSFSPPYLWHHVRHELLPPKTRLDGHHQNHVHKRDKGNHLLHWCPWFDTNTNLGRRWREGREEWGEERGEEKGEGREREGEGGREREKEGEAKGKGRERGGRGRGGRRRGGEVKGEEEGEGRGGEGGR